MKQDLFPQHWLTNTLLDDGFIKLHMTDDKELFIEKQAPGLLPLYQGKMIWQYTHHHDKPEYWLDTAAFDKRTHSKEL